jgi:hypothetical protein
MAQSNLKKKMQKNSLLRAKSRKTLLDTIAYLWPERPQLADHPYLSIQRVGPKTRPLYYKLTLDASGLNRYAIAKNLPSAPKKQKKIHPGGRVEGEYDPSATKGTSQNNSQNRWLSRKRVRCRVYNLGTYKTRSEAAIAYQLFEDTGEIPSKERVKTVVDTFKGTTIEDCF